MAQLCETMVCLDCDEVFERNRKNSCPVCGSEAIAPLSSWVVAMGRVNTVIGITYSQPVREVCHGSAH